MSGKIHKMILESWKKFKNFKFERNSIWICFTQLVQIARTAVASNYSENSFISTLSELFCCWTKSRTQKNIWVKYEVTFYIVRKRVVYLFLCCDSLYFPSRYFWFCGGGSYWSLSLDLSVFSTEVSSAGRNFHFLSNF